MPRMIEITTRRDGFRRAGVPHHGATVHPEGAFSAAELALLRSEPMLVVREIEQPAAADDGGEPAATKPRK